MQASTQTAAIQRLRTAGDAIAGNQPSRPLRKKSPNALIRQLRAAVRREPNTAAGVLAFWCKGSN